VTACHKKGVLCVEKLAKLFFGVSCFFKRFIDFKETTLIYNFNDSLYFFFSYSVHILSPCIFIKLF